MFRPKRRSVSEQGRFRTIAIVLLMLPLCAIIIYNLRVWNVIPFGSSGPYEAVGRSTYIPISIANIDSPATSWIVQRTDYVQGNEDAVLARLTYKTKSRYTGLLIGRPAMSVSLKYQYDGFEMPYWMRVRAGQEQRIWQSFGREFGTNWRSLEHPGLRTLFLPAIEDGAIWRGEAQAGEDALAPPRVRGSFATEREVVVMWDLSVDRAEVLPGMFKGTIPLWVAFAIGILIFSSASREIKAQRWVAMKCPKCGYERQRGRAECPECGLRYERPSYVTWDPTEAQNLK